MSDDFGPVCVTVPQDDLCALCRLAQEAGEDMHYIASREYAGDHPAVVRKREEAQAEAMALVDAAKAMAALSGCRP